MPKTTNIFLFSGNLSLSLEGALGNWKDVFRKKYGDLNFSRCSLAETSPSQLAAELSASPFLAEKRLTFVYTKGDIPKDSSEYSDEKYWNSLFKNIPEDHIVAFISPENLPVLEKKLERIATIKDYSVSSPDDVILYIKKQLPELDRANIQLLAGRIGENYLLLENEVGKLKLLESICEKDILENITEAVEVKIFTLIDLILSPSPKNAIPLLQKYMGTASEFEFLSSLLATIRNAGLYAGLVSGGVSQRGASETLGLKDFVARKYAAIPPARLSAFAEFYIHLCKTDVFTKTGRLVGDDGILHHIESGLLKYSLALKGNKIEYNPQN